MKLDPDTCYRALASKDGRFDGVFFVGVRTTGIYCRPVCPARTPGRNRCLFFRTAAEAEQEGFRACLRCRPERAPGGAPMDSLSRIVAAALGRIESGALDEGSLDGLASDLGISGRHLRRAVQAELGLSPVVLAQSRRLGMAKRLISETALSMTDIAFASGFKSVRRFNAAFKDTHRRSPSEFRGRGSGSVQVSDSVRGSGSARNGDPVSPGDAFTLDLEYRPPYNWPALLAFLQTRAVPGVELVRDQTYCRTVSIGSHAGPVTGWVAISPSSRKNALQAEISMSLASAVMPLVARLRHMFDLDSHPAHVAEHLAGDPTLAPRIAVNPGVRVPRAFDGFEVACRAILGQQVSVAAARTLASRLFARFGEPIETGVPGLTHLAPLPAAIAAAGEADLTGAGITGARARTLLRLGADMASGHVRLEPHVEPDRAMASLLEIPGIGGWTASYLAMRALGWPDAFLESDLGIRKALGGVTARQALALAEPWRPWRAYASMHLWMSLNSKES